VEHPADAAVFEQFGIACPGHDGVENPRRLLVRQCARELVEDHGFIEIAVCGLFQGLYNKVEDRQASQYGVEQVLTRLDVGGEKLPSGRGQFHEPAGS